ncbi:hypothetical protein C8R45DRAFT_945605 [Mycena sanguinolenta]|nr:hypothetical protein C8R45DRAFT_945605 [Mycena sanguinolenta]
MMAALATATKQKNFPTFKLGVTAHQGHMVQHPFRLSLKDGTKKLAKHWTCTLGESNPVSSFTYTISPYDEAGCYRTPRAQCATYIPALCSEQLAMGSNMQKKLNEGTKKLGNHGVPVGCYRYTKGLWSSEKTKVVCYRTPKALFGCLASSLEESFATTKKASASSFKPGLKHAFKSKILNSAKEIKGRNTKKRYKPWRTRPRGVEPRIQLYRGTNFDTSLWLETRKSSIGGRKTEVLTKAKRRRNKKGLM